MMFIYFLICAIANLTFGDQPLWPFQNRKEANIFSKQHDCVSFYTCDMPARNQVILVLFTLG